MLDNIAGAVNNEKVYLFMDNAVYHKNDKVKVKMKEHNIEPVFNVGYRFEYNACERLWSMYKTHFRKVLLRKMLDDPDPKSLPMKEALHETLCAKAADVNVSIPKFIKKALGMLRRDANEIRKQNGEEELEDIT